MNVSHILKIYEDVELVAQPNHRSESANPNKYNYTPTAEDKDKIVTAVSNQRGITRMEIVRAASINKMAVSLCLTELVAEKRLKKSEDEVKRTLNRYYLHSDKVKIKNKQVDDDKLTLSHIKKLKSPTRIELKHATGLTFYSLDKSLDRLIVSNKVVRIKSKHTSRQKRIVFEIVK